MRLYARMTSQRRKVAYLLTIASLVAVVFWGHMHTNEDKMRRLEEHRRLASFLPPPAPPYPATNVVLGSTGSYGCYFYYAPICTSSCNSTDGNGCCGCDEDEHYMPTGWKLDSWGMSNGYHTKASCLEDTEFSRRRLQSNWCRKDNALLVTAYVVQPWEWNSDTNGDWYTASNWAVDGYQFLSDTYGQSFTASVPDDATHEAKIYGSGTVTLNHTDTVSMHRVSLGNYPHISTLHLHSTLSAEDVFIADFSRSLGNVIVENSGASLSVSGTLHVGYRGHGTLQLKSGTATATQLIVASSNTASGTLLLEGGTLNATNAFLGPCDHDSSVCPSATPGDAGHVVVSGGSHTFTNLYISAASWASDFHRSQINIVDGGTLTVLQNLRVEELASVIHVHDGIFKTGYPWSISFPETAREVDLVVIGANGKYRYFDLGTNHASGFCIQNDGTSSGSNYNCVCSADGTQILPWLLGRAQGTDGPTRQQVRPALDPSINSTHTLAYRCVQEPLLSGYPSEMALEFYALPNAGVASPPPPTPPSPPTTGYQVGRAFKVCDHVPGWSRVSPRYTVYVRDGADSAWHEVPTYITTSKSPVDDLASHGYPANHFRDGQYEPGNPENLYGWTHSFANFEGRASARVEIKVVTDRALRSARVEPTSFGSVQRVEGREVYMTLTCPNHVHVDVNEQFRGEPWPLTSDLAVTWTGANGGYAASNPPKHALTIHCNPIESHAILSRAGIKIKQPSEAMPSLARGDTVYFAAGVHRISATNASGYTVNYETVVDGAQYYIPCDAVVEGSFYSAGTSDVVITGYGIITGDHKLHPGDDRAVTGINNVGSECWNTDSDPDGFERCAVYSPVSMIGSNLTVAGVTVVDAAYHTFRLADTTFSAQTFSTLMHVKTITWRKNGDGIIADANVRVENVFFRCQDDSYYINGHGMRNAVLWNDHNGASILFSKIGDMTGSNRADVVTVENVHVLYARANCNHWPNAGVLAMRGQGKPASNDNAVVVRNVYVTDPYQVHPGFKMMAYTPRSAYDGYSDDAECSSVNNVYCYQWTGWPGRFKRYGNMNALSFHNIHFARGNASDPMSSYCGRPEVFFGYTGSSACYEYTKDGATTCMVYDANSCANNDATTCDLTSHITATLTNITYGGESLTIQSLSSWVVNGASLAVSANDVAPSPPPGTTTTVHPPPPPPFGQARQDPHISFAHGGHADFAGNDGVYYHMLSAPGFQFAARSNRVNFTLHKSTYRKLIVNGTFFTAASWLVRSRFGHVYAIQSAANDTSFTIDDLTANKRIASFSGLWKGLLQDGVQAFYKQSTLFVRANGWETNVTRHPIYKRITGVHRWRFDVAMRPLEEKWLTKKFGKPSTSCYPHGIIGQSWDGDTLAVDGATDDYTYHADHPFVVTKVQAEGAIDGAAGDYELASPFDAQSKFSRFTRDSRDVCRPRNVSALSGTKRYTSASANHYTGSTDDTDNDSVKASVDVI